MIGYSQYIAARQLQRLAARASAISFPDSGVYVHVCPRDYRSEVDLGRADSDFSSQSVTCKQLNIYDRRIVWYAVDDDQALPVNSVT